MTDNRLTDHFIIAMPSLRDENFNQAVTYICEHDDNGTFGIIINRESDITLDDVMQQMNIPYHPDKDKQALVYTGGPVQANRGFILHRPTGKWESSLIINDTVALTTSRDILEAIAEDKGPDDTIIALGYAGWGPGQLEQEMATNTWLSCPAEEQIIFNTPIEERWEAAARLLGIDLQLLSNDAGHA
ncbi:MAG: YqgE/AlgH family protein [Gammaproteobacteria bacterium]|nr:YqgE/AlgH family protein [Gammaproteobacteria bacterium]